MATTWPSISMTGPPSNDRSKATSNSRRWSILPPRRELHADPASCTLPQIAAGPRRLRPTTTTDSPTRRSRADATAAGVGSVAAADDAPAAREAAAVCEVLAVGEL